MADALLSQEQACAIACADALLEDAGLPSYTQILGLAERLSRPTLFADGYSDVPLLPVPDPELSMSELFGSPDAEGVDAYLALFAQRPQATPAVEAELSKFLQEHGGACHG